MRKLICGKYAAIRLILIILSFGAFFLPIVTLHASLPYFDRTVTIGALGIKPLLDSGLIAHAFDILHAGILETQKTLVFFIACISFACFFSSWTMLIIWSFVLSEPKTAARRLLSISRISSISALLLIVLSVILQSITRGASVFTASFGAGGFLYATSVIVMLFCDTVYVKNSTAENVPARTKLTSILVISLSLIFVLGIGGIILGCAVHKNENESVIGTPVQTDENTVYVDKFPETATEAYGLVSQKINNVLFEKKERVEGVRALSVGKIMGSLTEQQKNVLDYISGEVTERISGSFTRSLVEYGEDTAGSLPDITAFGETANYTAEIADGGAFDIVMHYGKDVAKTLGNEETDAVLAAAKQAYAGLVTINNAAVSAKDTELHTRINEVNGVLALIEVRVRYNVSLNCTFIGEMSELGTQTVAFELTDTASYTVSREGIYIPGNEFYLAPGEELDLNASLNVPESFTPDDYRITYNSSNEALLTVDESGRVHALAASEKPVTVTVLLEFTNTTGVFYDYCEIYISEK